MSLSFASSRSECHIQFKSMKQDIHTKVADPSCYYYLINYYLEIDEHWPVLWKVNSPVS